MYKLTFLGTSSGMPTKYRNVSGLAVESINPYLSGDKKNSKNNRPWILIDCGEGTQHQLLKTKLSLHQLEAICITHVHGDHCYGLAGLLSSMAMSGRKTALKLIAPKAISKLLDTLTITTQLYFPFDIEFIAIESLFDKQDSLAKNFPAKIDIDFTPTHSLQIAITALSHRVDSFAFSLTQSIKHLVLDTDKLRNKGIAPSPIWGRLKAGEDVALDSTDIDSGDTDGGSTDGSNVLKSSDFVHCKSEQIKVVISGDNDEPSLLTEAIKNATLLVHESTYTQEVADKIDARVDGIKPQHSTAKQVATFANHQQLPYLILTHFSARYQLFDDPSASLANMGHVREEVEAYFDGKFEENFWLAEDFDRYIVQQDKVYKDLS